MRRVLAWSLVGAAFGLGLCLVPACAASSGNGFIGDADGGDGSSSNDGATNGDIGNLGDGFVPDTGGPGKTIFYAHTDSTLFSINADDPQLPVTKIGDFDCITKDGGTRSMTDIAVDKDGKLYGVTSSSVFLDMKIAGGTVQCANKGVQLPAIGNFYGATFAPIGTVDPAKEALVIANSEGLIFEVDTTSGALTALGNFGSVPANDGNGHTYVAANVGKAWELSGDIVFLANNGAPVGFATVRDCPNPDAGASGNCNRTDTLIEIDMSKLKRGNTQTVTKSVRGQVVKAASCNDTNNTTYGSMYGIAAFEGDIIGFSRINPPGTAPTLSLVVRIDNNTGTACLVQDQTGIAPGGWAGAGVTTVAAVKPPPVK